MGKKETKILFISRAYPPVVGGIENQNYELSVWMPKHAQVKTIANTHGKKFLPFFFVYALTKSLFLASKYDAILLGDGVLAIIGWILKIFSKKPVTSIVHGLDITYKNPLYQKLWVKFFIPKLDKLIAVGNETIKVGIKSGISKEKFVFVPNGVDTEKLFYPKYTRKDLEKITGLDLKDKKVILTLGRLSKRKGVAWFVKKVMPKLEENVIYLIAGEGTDKENIKNAVYENNLTERVKLYGKITEEERKILYNTIDLFVQPNIKIEGDMEGFGLVVLEAASCQRTVLASKMEGLCDAIKDGKNGFLTESGNAQKYIKKIEAILENEYFRSAFGRRAREYVIENYSWKKISKSYVEEIEKIIKLKKNKSINHKEIS